MGSILKFDEQSFSKEVENFVITKKVSFMEAILHLCEENSLDPSAVSSLLSKPIKERLFQEGQEINIIPKESKMKL